MSFFRIKHFSLIVSLSFISVFTGLAVFFNFYYLWHIKSNSNFTENALVWHDAQFLQGKMNQVATAMQIFKKSEQGLFMTQAAWLTASNQYFTVKNKYNDLTGPIELKREMELQIFRQDPAAYIVRYFPAALEQQKQEEDDLNRKIKDQEDLVQLESVGVKKLTASLGEPYSETEAIIAQLGFSESEITQNKMVDHWRQDERLKIQEDMDDINSAQSEIAHLKDVLDQEPQILKSNLEAQICQPFDAEINVIAKQTGLASQQQAFQAAEAGRVELEDERVKALEEQRENLEVIFKEGMHVRLFLGHYFFLPKHCDGFLCGYLEGTTTNFLLCEVKANNAHTISDSNIFAEAPAEYFLASEQKEWDRIPWSSWPRTVTNN
jgi:regulator of replication initiation timing